MASVTYDHETIADKAVAALRAAFPNSAVETERGFEGRVHVRIMSPSFDGKRETTKQALVWDVLHAALGPEAEAVSLVLVYGMDELP